MAIVCPVPAIFEIEMEIVFMVTVRAGAEDRHETRARGFLYFRPEGRCVGLLQHDNASGKAKRHDIDGIAPAVLGQWCTGNIVSASANIGGRVGDGQEFALSKRNCGDVVAGPIGQLLCQITP